ncbi:MAG TPA: endonuclease III [Candidatus Stercoripulliclostridium merdigallinarum]|uniref:Endonuclease III n=1 Tax=Candidatus Stercoripulliclostridium merdigallinarum TaxID=2840951 RepID=A0A9D1MHQ4_9FIRM|nr:endonuclease III [Candidatus Stercoripulliclostridium merdigallinarum]
MDNKRAQKILDELKKMHPDAGCELNYGTPFELLVAVILSAQCTDKRVNEVTKDLFKKYNTPEQYATMTPAELEPLIHSCGFFHNKAVNIIGAAKGIVDRFGGEVPKTMAELTSLPGVGRKTASVVMTVAFDEPAMPVDTHVFRVSGRLGLSHGKNPEQVEKDLKDLYPPSDWNIVHHTLIFHGRYICKALRPNCSECTLTEYCPYFKENN